MEKPKHVLSGTYREGNVGEPTNLIDSLGKELSVGDIVVILTKDNFGITSVCGLSCVVSDRYISYSDGTHKEKKGAVEYFVMGIKRVDYIDKDSENWHVIKIKDFADVVSGEHWKEYGFNYK